VELTELEAEVSVRRDWRFGEEGESARWWNVQLSKLIRELESLTAAETGLLAPSAMSAEHGWSVARRLVFARHLQDGFAADGEFAVRWATALPAIGEAYPGLGLGVQVGLVPIGADAASGLWEFWHVQSGVEPLRGEEGRLVIEDSTGIVLVLLPRGKFWMGAQKTHPSGQNHYADARQNEGPVHEVVLSAFFLSKYELTQSQWERQVGSNPSRWTAETRPSWIEGSHPVESISWTSSVTLLPQLGLSLPSEAQWEYGARAGTETPRPFGFDEFAMYANIADQAYDRAFTGSVAVEDWDDGLGGHAPVGRLKPNAFGLFDVIGNVWEWCLDGFDSAFYGRSELQDPISPSAGSATRVGRGGGFDLTAIFARSAFRGRRAPAYASWYLGVRPARVITD
jgi:formylglycine-generating enzyme required for sulfatase activity